jgi:hypothetical protein
MKQRAVVVMFGDEGAPALAAHHYILGRQFIQRLAHRALADPEQIGELELTGQHFTRPPLTGDQPLHQKRLDLGIERLGSRGLNDFRGVVHGP